MKTRTTARWLASLCGALAVFFAVAGSSSAVVIGDIGIYSAGTAGEALTTADLKHGWDTTVRADAGAYPLVGGNDITMSAGYHLVMYNSRFNSSGGSNRSEIQSQIQINGGDIPFGWSQGYIRRSNGQNETITAGGAIIKAEDNDLLSLNSFRTDNNGAGVARADGASAIQLLKLDDTWDYLQLSLSADQAGPTDGTWTPVAYDVQDEIAASSFGHTPGSGDVTLKEPGHYMVFANTYGFESTDRTILMQRLTLDGSLVPGSRSTVYIRGNQNSASEGAASIGMIVETTLENQVLNVQGALDVNRSPFNYIGGKTGLTIAKLPDDGDYIRLDDSGTDNFNAGSATPMGWDDELELDAGAFTHSDSQVGVLADDDYLFLTALHDNDDQVQRGFYWQRWRTNGTDFHPFGYTGKFSRNTGGADKVGNWSGALLGMQSGDYVEVVSQALGASGTLSADEKGLQGVRLGSILIQAADLVWDNSLDNNWMSAHWSGTTPAGGEGMIIGGGRVLVNSNVTGALAPLKVALNGGELRINSGRTLEVASGLGLEVASGATLNLVGGTLTTPKLVAGGTQTIGAGSTLNVGGSLIVDSALDASAGTLNATGAGIEVNPGGSLIVGGPLSPASLDVNGSMTGTVLNVAGDLNVGGTVNVVGGDVLGSISVIDGSLTTANPLTAPSVVMAGPGATLNGPITATKDYFFEDATVPFDISGAANVNAEAGTVNFTGAGAQDYTGATFVTGGTLNVNAPITATQYLSLNGGSAVLNEPLTTIGSGVTAGLDVSVYNGATGLALVTFDGEFFDPIGASFMGVGGRLADHPVQRGISTWNVADNTAATNLSAANGDQYQVVWTGQYNADEDGDHLFRVGQRANPTGGIDDDGSFYIDTNQNGIFETSERIATAGNGQVSAGLTAGTSYDIAIGFNENAGGINFGGYFSKPSDAGAWTLVNPGAAAQAGLWTSVAPSASVTDGTLEINATLTTSELFVNDLGIVNAGAAVATNRIVINPGGTYNADAASSAGNGTVDVAGGGVLTAGIANALAGTTAINLSGSLEVAADGGAGGAAIAMSPGGYVNVTQTQSAGNFPAVTLVGGAALGGDLTNVVYGAGGVVLAEDAVLIPVAGPEPTRAQAGGAILLEGIIGVDNAATYNFGDNGVDSIYKGGAFGVWSDAGPFEATVNDVSAAGTGLYIRMVGDLTLNSTTTLNTGNTDRGAEFAGPGSLLVETPVNTPGASGVMTRTGLFDDAAGLNTTNDWVVQLPSGAIGAGQTMKVTAGKVSIQAQDSVADGGTLEIGADAALNIVDNADGRLPTTGTYNIGPGGLVLINNNNRLKQGATFNFDPDAYILFNHDAGVTSADPRVGFPGLDFWGFDNVNIIISENTFGEGLFLGEGRRLTTPAMQAQGTDVNNAGTVIRPGLALQDMLDGIVQPPPGFDPFVIFSNAVAGSGDLSINSPIQMAGVDLVINDPVGETVSLPRTDADLTRMNAESNGNVNLNRKLTQVDSIEVRNGRLRFGNNNDYDLEATGSLTIRDGATVELQGFRPNLRPKMADGSVFPEGIFVDKGGYLNVRYHQADSMAALPITFRGTGDVADLGRDFSLFRTDEQGGGGNALFGNVTLGDGAHVGIDRQDQSRTELRISLNLTGNATIERQPDEFTLMDISSVGALNVLRVGAPGEGGETDVRGMIGLGDSAVYLDLISSTLDLETSASIGANTIVANRGDLSGVAGAGGLIRVRPGKDGTNEISVGEFQLGDGEDLEIRVDEVGAGPTITNHFGATVRILDDGNPISVDGRITAQRDTDSTLAGTVDLSDVVLEGAAELVMQRANAALFNISGLDVGDGGTVDTAGTSIVLDAIGGRGTIEGAPLVTLADAAAYNWQISPLAFDSIGVDALTLDNAWTLSIDAAAGSAAAPTDEYDLFTYTGALTTPRLGDVLNAVTIDYGATGWSGGEVKFDDATGRVYLTNLQNAATLLTWGGGANWATGTWLPGGGPPDAVSIATVDAGIAPVQTAGQTAFRLAVDAGGTVNIAGGGELTAVQRVDVADGGTLGVDGLLNAPVLNSAGATTLGASATGTIGALNVSGGTTAIDGIGAAIPALNASGGVVNASVALTNVTDLNSSGGVVNANAGGTLATLNIDVGGTVSTAAPLIADTIDLEGTLAMSADVTANGTMNFRGTLVKDGAGAAAVAADTLRISGRPNLTVNQGQLTVPAPSAAEVLQVKLGGGHDGSMTFEDGIYTIQASGHDIWGTNDGAHFAYQAFPADQPLSLIANVGVVDGYQAIIGGINGWAKAGVMIRQSLDANSRMAAMIIANNDGNGINPQMRTADGAGAIGTNTTGARINHAEPVWLRLDYLGDGVTFEGYYSDDPASGWILDSSAGFTLADPLSGTMYGGLAVTAHDNNNLTQMRFGDVEGFNLGTLFGDLTMAPATDLVLTDSGAASFESITGANGATIHGDTTLLGTMAPAGGNGGTLNVDGDMAMGGDSVYRWITFDGSQTDRVAVTGDLDVSSDWDLQMDLTGAVANGTYELFSYGGALLDPELTGVLGEGDILQGNSPYNELVNLAATTVTHDAGNKKIMLNLVSTNANVWTGAAGTSWGTAGSWTGPTPPPNASRAAVVPATANPANITSGARSAHSLIIDEGTVNITGGSLAVINNAHVMAGSTLNVSGSGALTLGGNLNSVATTTIGGTLTAAEMNVSDGVTTFGAGAGVTLDSLNVTGGAVNTAAGLNGVGTLAIDGGDVASTVLLRSANVSLADGSLTTPGATMTGGLDLGGGLLSTSSSLTADTVSLHGGTLVKTGAGVATLSGTSAMDIRRTDVNVAAGELRIDVPTTVSGGTYNVMLLSGAVPPGRLAEQNIMDDLHARTDATFTVTPVDDDAPIPANFEEIYDLVITTNQNNTPGVAKYGDSTVPMLVASYQAWNALGWAEMGQDGGDGLTIDIVDPVHPLAAGYSGVVTVYTGLNPTPRRNAVGLAPSADMVAAVNGLPAIFAFDAGDELLDGRITAAKQIGTYWSVSYEEGGVTPEAEDLFNAAVDYAMTPSLNNVTLADGVQLTLAGAGVLDIRSIETQGDATVAGTVRAVGGLTPVAGGSGSLTVDGDLVMVVGHGTLNWDALDDVVDVTGELTLQDNWTVKLGQSGAAPDVGTPYSLITYGTIAGMPDASGVITNVNVDSSEVGWADDAFVRYGPGAGGDHVFLYLSPTLTWADATAGNFADGNWNPGLQAPPAAGLGRMIVPQGTVTVNDDYFGQTSPLSVTVNGTGTLNLADEHELEVVEAVTVADTGTLNVGTDAFLSTATLDNSGVVTVGGGGTLEVFGGPVNSSGTLGVLDGGIVDAVAINTSGVAGLLPGAVLDVETLNATAGTLNIGADVPELNVSGDAAMATIGPMTVGTMNVTGTAVVNTDASPIGISDRLILGEGGDQMAFATVGADFQASGTDLANSAVARALTVNGGTFTILSNVAPADGLLANWKFDDGAGTTAVNSVASIVPDGVLQGFTGDEWVAGVVGGALNFDGADHHVNVPGYKGIGGAAPRTIAGWIRSTAGDAAIMSWGDDVASNKWIFRLQTGNGTPGAIRVEVNGGYTVGSTDLRDNEWHHVAAVVPDGAGNVQDVLLYVDGELEVVSASLDEPLNTSAGADVRIGQDHSSREFVGAMDDLYLYDRALAIDELGMLYGGGAGPGGNDLDLAASDLTVTAAATINAPADSVALGNLDVPNVGTDVTFANVDAAKLTEYSFANLSAADGATITGALSVRDVLSPGGVGAAGMLNVVNTDALLQSTTTLSAELAGGGADAIEYLGSTDLMLAGTLDIVPVGVTPAQGGTTAVVPLVVAAGEGVLQGQFAVAPPQPGAGEPVTAGHLGLGVFNLGVNYVEAVPASDPPTFTEVNAEIFYAEGGDSNADGNIDGQDIQTLIINFNLQGDPPDRNWLRGDTAGGITGRGDGWVDGQDITALITNFTGDAGPIEPGTAAAEYNPATGEVKVTVDGVMNWSLTSDGLFAGSDLDALQDVLPLGDAANLVSANPNTVGEGLPGGSPFSYQEVDLGQIVEPGTDAGSLQLVFVSGFGSEPQIGSINVVPEPGSLMILLSGGLALLWIWRRRRAA